MKKKVKLTYLKKATKFLKRNNAITEAEVDALVIRFIKRHFYGIDVNIDYKQMQGNLSDFYRIRKGAIRIIVTVQNDEIIIEAIIQDIGYRGDIYRK